MAAGGRDGGWAFPRAGWVLLLGLALLGARPAVGASLESRVRTLTQLELARDFGPPRAFVKGNDVRLHYAVDQQTVVFKAEWAKPRVQLPDYQYRLAELRFDRTPPQVPGARSSWREVVVLERKAWIGLAREVADAWVPARPHAGRYFEFAVGEGVLYRDAGGELRIARWGQTPSGVELVGRLNAQEFAVGLARGLESRLQAAFPQQDLFLLVSLEDGARPGFLLLDVARRECVMLLPPRLGDDPPGGVPVAYSIRMLGALVIESHGLALLKNPVSSAGRLVHTALQALASLLGPGLRPFPTPPGPIRPGVGMDLEAWERWLDRYTGSRREPGTVKFLINGEEFFPVLQRRVAEATESVWIDVGIFDRDDFAVEFADQLRERSATVDVRIIQDRISSQAAGISPAATPPRPGFVAPASIGAYLQHGSRVRVRPFLNPWFTADHGKLFLVDGRYAYLGGMNIGRESRYEWHDLMVELEGPIVARFAAEFDRAWAHASLLGDLAYANRALSGADAGVGPAGEPGGVPLRRLHTRPGSLQIRKAVLGAIERAQQRIFLENPYLYDNAVIVGLVQARRRGVDVRVILPSENDLLGGRSGNMVTANYLFHQGVRVFFYPGMTHAKALLVDGWVTFGSANFNRLSLRTNHETNLATSDLATVREFEHRLFEVDFGKSHEIHQPVSVGWTDHVADVILNHF